MPVLLPARVALLPAQNRYSNEAIAELREHEKPEKTAILGI